MGLPPAHIPRARTGLARGYSVLTSAEEGLGIELGMLRLDAGEAFRYEGDGVESAWVLLGGSLQALLQPASWHEMSRASLFDERPWVIHLPPGEVLELRARGQGAELAVAKTAADRRFEPRVFAPSEVQTEFRGRGLAQDACLRQVRAVFDLENRPESNLVVGEVVNYPGRWSSYPPHHHEQPEIYHYRFSEPQGYGHAEVGESVFKVRDGDTVVIPGGRDHAQVSAPGYGMYYLWVVRHLPGKPYRGFEFAEEHKWLLDPQRQGWVPPR